MHLDGILESEELEKLPAYTFLIFLDVDSSFIIFPSAE
jgi:hypothetical protein